VAGLAVLLAAGMGRSVADGAAGILKQIGTRFFSRECVVLPVTTEAVVDVFMSTSEHRAGFFMIEIFGVERHDRLIRPLVFGMADDAVFAFVPVVTVIPGNAYADLLVTGQALIQGHFHFIVVTLAAVFKPWGILVGSAQISRRIGNLEYLLCSEMCRHQKNTD